MESHHHEIISESTHGHVSYCPYGDQYEMSFKNTLIVISDQIEFERIHHFFQGVQPRPVHDPQLQKKNYIFQIAKSTTFFAFDKYEMEELKELLARAQFQMDVKKVLNCN